MMTGLYIHYHHVIMIGSACFKYKSGDQYNLPPAFTPCVTSCDPSFALDVSYQSGDNSMRAMYIPIAFSHIKMRCL
jgi:hypothetical protein